MDSTRELNLQLEHLQKRLQKLKKENVQREDFLHSGELSLIRIIAHYNHRFDRDPTLVAVSNVIGVSQATVTTLADRLIKKGLIIKQTSPTDKRAKLVSLTAKGEQYLMLNQARHMAKVQGLATALGEADTIALTRIIEKINRHLEEQ